MEAPTYDYTKYHIKRKSRSARPRRPRQDLQRLAIQGGTFFLRNVPLFCNYNHMINYFERYGEIEKIRFLHRRDKTYTLCCKIKMKNITAVHEILSTKNHQICGHRLKPERYYGRSAHPDVFQRGIYKMGIEGLAPIRGGRGGQMLYTYMENMLEECRYTGMQLERANHTYTGFIEVRFSELLDKLRAWEKLEFWGFRVSTPPRGRRVL